MDFYPNHEFCAKKVEEQECISENLNLIPIQNANTVVKLKNDKNINCSSLSTCTKWVSWILFNWLAYHQQNNAITVVLSALIYPFCWFLTQVFVIANSCLHHHNNCFLLMTF